jgi:hypothetical protein
MNLEMSRSEELILIDTFKHNPKLIIEWGFTPDILPFIVETYTDLCIQIFYSLNDNTFIDKYLTH